nr:hypothetical protein Itr_chr08CG12680 [Ipomoea trifida]
MKDVAAGVHHGRWKTGDDRGRSCYVLAGCSSLPPTICSVDVVAARRRRRITELTRCAAVASRRGKDRWALPLLSPAQFAIAARQRECRHPTPLPCTVGEQGRGTPLPLRKVSLLHASRRWKENVEPAGNTRTHRVALISPEPFRLELQPPVAHASFHRHCCSVSKVAGKLHCCDSTQAVIPSWTPPGEGETTAATLQARRSTLLRRRGHGMKDVAAGVHHGRWKTGDDRGRSCYVLAGCSSLPPTICSVDVVAARRRRRITELTRCAAVASRRGKDRWALPLLSPAQFAIAARQRECRHPTPLPCTVGEQGRGTPLPLRKVSLLHASRRWKENVEPAGNTRTHRVALISPEPFRLELQSPVAHASFHRHCCSVSKVTRKGGKGLLPCPYIKEMANTTYPSSSDNSSFWDDIIVSPLRDSAQSIDLTVVENFENPPPESNEIIASPGATSTDVEAVDQGTVVVVEEDNTTAALDVATMNARVFRGRKRTRRTFCDTTTLTFEKFSEYFYLPFEQAAEELQVGREVF